MGLQIINDLINKCNLKLKYEDGLTDCLGMRVKKVGKSIYLNQRDKREELTKICNIVKVNGQWVPIKTDKLIDICEDEDIINEHFFNLLLDHYFI